MILDSHCHAWRRWPYDPLVPDPASRGSVEQLLYEMDANGVEKAALVCARIGTGSCANDDNNDYAAEAAARHPDRLVVIADIDCSWRPEHHTPGAARRLRETAERLGIAGFTHYVHPGNDGWFTSEEGMGFFAAAAELNLIASLALSPAWQRDLRQVARAFPTLPILVHHLGGLSPARPSYADDLAETIASAAQPNILIKVSGFHYVSARGWDFPYADARETFRQLFQAYGPDRMCWGSDFPAARAFLTYTQSLEVVRSHCDFLQPHDLDQLLGDTLARVLATRRPATIAVPEGTPPCQSP
ncbi:amidohydrolase family protein [Actinopolymorpha alba]|uniref:amidohydrolase family protein n=1 Tax=Actinopolymorpha alba TaxID=533267 RepID=UPI000376E05C|nr:amidohydrolase family protein [Actinopolymorpha alba]